MLFSYECESFSYSCGIYEGLNSSECASLFLFCTVFVIWGIEEKCADRQEAFVYLLKQTVDCVLWFGGLLCVIQLASVSLCLNTSRNNFCVCVDGREWLLCVLIQC